MTPPPSSKPGFDAEQCLQALTGQAAQGESARAGSLMRELLGQQLRQQEQAFESQDEALLERLRRAGAFAPRPPSLLQRLRLARTWRPWTLLPLGAALCGLLWLQLLPPHEPALDDADVLRGAESAQQLQVADPARRVAELQALLQRHGVVARVTSLPSGRVQLQALVPAATSGTGASLREALAAEGVTVPAHGRLILLIHADKGKP